MIKSFKYKNLQLFFESETLKGIQVDHAKKLRIRLSALDTAFVIEDLKLPGFNLHELEGNKKGIWFIKINGNYRLTFIFENSDVYILDYEDYY